jgi:hypothetical protein
VPARRFAIDPERPLWDRQTNEGDESWEAFVEYRDMAGDGEGKRSVRAVAKQIGKSSRLVQRWSTDHEWQRRVQAFDRDRDATRLAEQAAAIKRAAKRQGRALEAAVMALMAPVEAYLEKLREQGGPRQAFGQWTLRELQAASRESLRLLPALVQAERLVHGLSTSKGEHVITDPARAAAEARVRDMDRSELDAYLLGVEDGRAVEREDALG